MAPHSTVTPMSLGPQNPTKNLTHLVDLLGHLLSRNHVSNFSDLGPPKVFWGFVLRFGFCPTYPNFWDFPTFVLLFGFFSYFSYFLVFFLLEWHFYEITVLESVSEHKNDCMVLVGYLHHLYYSYIQGFTIVQWGGCVASTSPKLL